MKNFTICFLLSLILMGCETEKENNLDAITFTLDGQQYQLPATIEDFTDNGWMFCDFIFLENEITLENRKVYQTRYCKDYHAILLTVANSNLETVTLHETKVIGIQYDARIARFVVAATPSMSLPDNLIEINGVHLGTTFDEAKELWKDYPNFVSNEDSVSYHFSLENKPTVHGGLVEISYIFGEVNQFSAFSEDITTYIQYIAFDEKTIQTNERKSYAIPVSDNYNTPSNLYYKTVYLKATVIAKDTFTYRTEVYTENFEGYLVEDELGHQFVILATYDDIFQLSIGQECEFWGLGIESFYTMNNTSIVVIEIFYTNLHHDGKLFEIFNIEYYDTYAKKQS